MVKMISKQFLKQIWVTFALAFFLCGQLSAQLTINELSASNSSTIFDEDGDSSDWIELQNTSDQAIQLSNYFISDDAEDLTKYALPEYLLKPGDFILLFASDKNRAGGVVYWETIIQENDETRYLVPQSAVSTQWVVPNFIDSSWETGSFGIGYGDNDDLTEIQNGSISVYTRTSFTLADASKVKDIKFHIDFDDAYIAFLNGVEISRENITGANPVAYNQGADNYTEPKLVFGNELSQIDLKNYTEVLVEGENMLAIQLHNFNVGSSDLTLIPFLTLGFNEQPENGRGVAEATRLQDVQIDYPHTNFKLSSAGETVVLSTADGTVIDEITYPPLAADESYGKSTDGSDYVYFTEPTPGAANDTPGFASRSTVPELTIAGGFYSQTVQVGISNSENASQTFYTIDGSVPTESSPNFGDGAVEISSTVTLKVRKIEAGKVPSDVVVESYFINEEHDLPVVAVSTHPDNLWSDESGIYVIGTNGIPGWGVYENGGANWNQDWEIPIHFELFETDGSKAFGVGAGAKIGGAWSRSNPAKSLKIYFRSEYGANALEYQMFESKEIDSFQSIVLRNSGNDFSSQGHSMFRDGLMTTLVQNTENDIQAFRPAVLYLNGEYWGIHNIREKINEHFIESNSTADADDIDLLQGGGEKDFPNSFGATHGTVEHYDEMMSFIISSDLNDPELFAQVEELIDIDNYIDYMIAQIYYANTDWPGNNIKLWRSRSEGGKWRWILYDTDFGFNLSYGGQVWHNTIDFALEPNGPGWPNPPWSTILFREMVESEKFRQMFVNRLADMMNSVYEPSYVEDVIDSLAGLIASEIPRHMANQTRSGNWGGSVSEWNNQIGVLKDFANQRPQYMQDFITQQTNNGGKFGFGAMRSVRVTVSDLNHGYVRVNRLDVDRKSWTGQYFSGTKIPVTAIARPGYRFAGWSGDIQSQSKTIEVGAGVELVANFEESQAGQELVINEIMYHSSDGNDSEDWVEIYNPGSSSINMSGFVLKDDDDTHSFIFPDETSIEPESFLVVAKELVKFNAVYPGTDSVIGDLGFGLSGNSDKVRLYNADGLLLDSLTYDDEAPWPVDADGSGYSLELIDAQSDNALASNWRASTHALGSPGLENGLSVSKESEVDIPETITLFQNYPNPFNPSTNITFEIPAQQHVSISVYSISGQRIATLTDAPYAAGKYSLRWNASNNASGIYFYVLETGGKSFSKKMTLIK